MGGAGSTATPTSHRASRSLERTLTFTLCKIESTCLDLRRQRRCDLSQRSLTYKRTEAKARNESDFVQNDRKRPVLELFYFSLYISSSQPVGLDLFGGLISSILHIRYLH